MAFSQKELDIIKYGQANGKSRAEVESALASFRSGVAPTPKPQSEQTPTEYSLKQGLSRVSDIYGKNLKEQFNAGLNRGAEALTTQPEAVNNAIANKDKTAEGVAYARGGLRLSGGVAQSLFSPITAAIQTGIQGYSELDQATGGRVANQIKSVAENNPEIVQGISDFVAQNPEKVKDVEDLLNFLGAKAVTKSASMIDDGTRAVVNRASDAVGGGVTSGNAFDAVKNSSGNLTQKALDFISADPSKKVETILKRSTPEELDNYLAIAEKSSQSGEAKSVFEVVGDKMFDATKELSEKAKEIGKAKSDIVTPLREGLGAFRKETVPLLEKLNSLKNNLSEIDRGQKSKIQAIINDAKTVATKRDADMFIDKVQNALYVGNKDMTIPKGSALDKQLRGILGEYNTSLKKSLPEEYAKLNERYSELVSTLEVLNRGLGEVVEGTPIRGAGLVKQYFSPSASRTKELFEFIKNETGGRIDLAKDATLAKFAGQLYDDANVNSLLGGIKDIPTTPSAIVSKVIERVGGEKVTDALRSSTVKKAKSSTSPKESKATSVVDKKTPTESKLVQPSTNSTTNPTKGKGIRGMIELNPKNWFEEVGNSADVGLKAKTKDLQLDMAKEAARTMRNNGVTVEVPTSKNAVQILEQAKEIARKKKVSDVIKAETPSDKMKPFLEPKKKVASDVPKTIKIWNKSKFSNDGAYADVPVIRREDNITLYQGGSDGKRQFWTPDRKYAEKFGEVKSKTGSFYKVDNGNRVTDVYVEVPSSKVVSSLEQEAKKSATPSKVYHGTPSDFKGEPNFPLYLTSDKSYADIYQSPSASSLSSGKKSGVPTTKEFTVNPNAKVLDSRTPEGKKLLKEYWDNYSVSGMQVKTESGLPDWTEGTNLEEFLAEKGYKYDAILLDEGGVPSNNGTKSRGVSFVALNKNAFK